MNFVKYFMMLLVPILLVGCGVRAIHHPDGVLETELFLGLGSTVACEAAPGVTAEVTTLGMWGGGRGGGVGFHQARFFCGSPSCQIILWPTDTFDVVSIQDIVSEMNGVCVIK